MLKNKDCSWWNRNKKNETNAIKKVTTKNYKICTSKNVLSSKKEWTLAPFPFKNWRKLGYKRSKIEILRPDRRQAINSIGLLCVGYMNSGCKPVYSFKIVALTSMMPNRPHTSTSATPHWVLKFRGPNENLSRTQRGGFEEAKRTKTEKMSNVTCFRRFITPNRVSRHNKTSISEVKM